MVTKFHEPWIWYWAGVLWTYREHGQDALQDAAEKTILRYLDTVENEHIQRQIALIRDLDQPNTTEVNQAVWSLARKYVASEELVLDLMCAEMPTSNLEVTPNGIRKISKAKAREKVKAKRRDDHPNASPF